MTPEDDRIARLSAHQRLLLVAALAEADTARDAWRSWCDAVPFDDVDGASTRLLALVARRPEVVSTDDPLHGRVRGLYRRAWVHNERLLSAADEVCRSLASADVPVLHVEARSLASAFGDHATRPLHDVDMCVPRRSVRHALDLLADLGWTDGTRTVRARWQRRPHHLVRGEARVRIIDDRPWPGAHTSVWISSRPGDRPTERLLGLHDALVHASLRSVQPWQPPGGYWVADVVRLTIALGHRCPADAWDDPRLVERATAHDAVTTVRRALTAAERIVGPSGRSTSDLGRSPTTH